MQLRSVALTEQEGELRGRQDFKGIIGFSGGERDHSLPTDYKGQTLRVFP